jgi:hypothetical protein
MCLLDVLKCEFGGVDESMFHGVNRPYELIFCSLGNQKSDLDVVAEMMFQEDEWP